MNNNCKLEEPFILPLDSNQRLLASLAFISEVTEGEKGLKQSRDIGPLIHHWNEDKLFQSIEKCQFYRKLTFDDNNNNNNRLSLYYKSNSLLNKFSEYGDNLLLCNKDIQVARISLTEISTCWLNLIDLFISYSSASSIPLYLLFEHDNDYSVIHIPPLISGNDNQPISLFQINQDVYLYSRTLNDLRFLLDRWIQPFRKIIESDQYNDDILEFSVVAIVQSNWCNTDDRGNRISINDRLESLQRILETQRQTEKEENIDSMKLHLEKLQTILTEDMPVQTSTSNILQYNNNNNNNSSIRDDKFLRDSRESDYLRSSDQSYSRMEQSVNLEPHLPMPPARLSSSRGDLRYSQDMSYPPPLTMETSKSQIFLSSPLNTDIIPIKIDTSTSTSISRPSFYDDEQITFTKKKDNAEAVRFSVANNLSESVVADLMRSQEGEDLNSYGLRAYEMIKEKVFGKLNLHVNNSIEQFSNVSDLNSDNNLNKSVTRSISDIKEMKETAKGNFSPLSSSANRDVDEILRKWNNCTSQDNQDNQNSFSNNLEYNQMDDNRDYNERYRNSEYEYDVSEQLNDDITVDTAPGFYSFMQEELSPDRRSPSKNSQKHAKKATDLYPINEQEREQSSSNPWSPTNSPRSLASSLKTSPVNTFPDNSLPMKLLPPSIDSPKFSKTESLKSPERLPITLSPNFHMKHKQADIPISPAHSLSNSIQPSKEAIEYATYHLNKSANEVREPNPSKSRDGLLSPTNEMKTSVNKPQVLMSQHSPNLKMRKDFGTSSSPYLNSRDDDLNKVNSSLQKSFYDIKSQMSSSVSKSPIIQFPPSQSLFGDSVSPQRSPQILERSLQRVQLQLSPQRNSIQIDKQTINNNIVETDNVNENDDDVTIIEEELEEDCDTTISGGEDIVEEEKDTKKHINDILVTMRNEEPMIRASLSNLISNEMANYRSTIEQHRKLLIRERAWKRKEQGLHILSLVLGKSSSNLEKSVADKGIYHPQKQKGLSIPSSQIEVKTKKNAEAKVQDKETVIKREKGKVWDININIEPKRPQQRGASAGPLQKRAYAYSNADADASSVGTPRAQSAGKSRRGESEQRVSNQQQIKNALTAVCLAGSHLDSQRIEAISKLDQYFATRENGGPPFGPINQFIILLFNAKSLSFRGIYAVSPINGEIFKIFGKGPKLILSNYVQDYLKYESASRAFKILPTKSISATVDAISVDPAKLKKLMNNLVV